MSVRSPSTVDRQIGKKIRIRRRVCRLTQQELADKLGISPQQLQKYEAGANRIPAGRLFDVAQIVNTRIEDFFPPQVESQPQVLWAIP